MTDLAKDEAALVFSADGNMRLVLPDMLDEEDVPEHVTTATVVFMRLSPGAVAEALAEALRAAVEAEGD